MAELYIFPAPPTTDPVSSRGLSPSRPRLERAPRTAELTSRALQRHANRPRSLTLVPASSTLRGSSPFGKKHVRSVTEWKKDDRVEKWRADVLPQYDRQPGARIVIGEPSELSLSELKRVLDRSLADTDFHLPDLQLPLSPAPQLTPTNSLTGIPTPTTDVHASSHPIMVPTLTYSAPHEPAYDNLRERAEAAARGAEERQLALRTRMRLSQQRYMFPHRDPVNDFTGTPSQPEMELGKSSSAETLLISLDPSRTVLTTAAPPPDSFDRSDLTPRPTSNRDSTYSLTPIDLRTTPPKAAALLGLFPIPPRKSSLGPSASASAPSDACSLSDSADLGGAPFSEGGRKNSASSASSACSSTPFGRPSISSSAQTLSSVAEPVKGLSSSVTSFVHPFEPRSNSLQHQVGAHSIFIRGENPTVAGQIFSPAPFEMLLPDLQAVPDADESSEGRPAKSTLRCMHKSGKSVPLATLTRKISLGRSAVAGQRSLSIKRDPRKARRRSASQPAPPVAPPQQVQSGRWAPPSEWEVDLDTATTATVMGVGFAERALTGKTGRKTEFERRRELTRRAWEGESERLRLRLSAVGVGPAVESERSG